MNKFFAVDGPFLTFLTKVGQLIMLSVLWIVCSLPLITIAASSSAFYYAVIKTVRRDVGYPVREFFKIFKMNLLNGLIISAITIVWLDVLWRNLDYISGIEGQMHLFLYMGTWALIFITICFLIYLFPVMSRFAVSKRKWIGMSLNLLFRRLPYTIVLAASLLVLIWIAVFYISIVCLIIVPGLWCYLATYLIEPALKVFMPERKEGEEKEWYDE